MSGNDVRIGVGVNDSASSALDKIRDKFDTLGASKGAQSILMGVGLAAGQMAFNALGNAASAAVGQITGSVDAAKQMEVAQAKLDQALRNTGSSYAANAAAVEEVSKRGVNLGFTDDAIIGGMARLVTATGSTAKATYAMGIAQDLARLKGISLEEATTALTTIEGGRFRGLAQLGINLKVGTTVEEALTAVRAKASGQADAFAKTEVGAWDRVGAKWDQTQEQLGNMLLPALTDLANVLADDVVPAASGIIDSFGKLGPVFVGVGTAAAVALAPGLFAAAAGAAALTIAALPVILPLAALAAAVALVTSQLGKAHSGYGDMGNGLNVFGERVDATSHTVAAAAKDVTAFGDASLAAASAGRVADAALAAYAATWGVASSAVSDANLDIARAYVESSMASQKWSAQFRTDMQATAPALNTVKADFNTFLDTLGVGPARAKLQGELTGAKLAAGLKTGTAASRAAGAALVKTLTDQLAGLSKPESVAAQMAELAGEKITLEQARGIAKAAKDPKRMALIDTALAGVSQKMINLGTLSYTYGFNTGGEWTGGIVASIKRANPQIAGAIAHITSLLRAKSPPGPESPLHEIGTWGFNTGQHYIDKMSAALGNTSGVKSALAGLAPAFAGSGGGFGGGSGGGGGLTVNGPLVSYSPMLSTATSGELQRASRILGPGIVRELRGRGLIPQGSY